MYNILKNSKSKDNRVELNVNLTLKNITLDIEYFKVQILTNTRLELNQNIFYWILVLKVMTPDTDWLEPETAIIMEIYI